MREVGDGGRVAKMNKSGRKELLRVGALLNEADVVLQALGKAVSYCGPLRQETLLHQLLVLLDEY